MDTRYASVIFPEPPPRILGRRLRPYCLWHALQIDALGEHIVRHPLHGLVALLEVCGDGIRSWSTPTGWRSWLSRVRVRYLLGSRARYKRAWAAYTAYRDAAMAGCPRYYSRYTSRPCKTPWQLFVVSRLVTFGGISYETAWTLPIADALWRAAALSEAHGADIHLLSARDEAALLAAGYDLEAEGLA